MNLPCMIVKKGCICKGDLLNNAYLRSGHEGQAQPAQIIHAIMCQFRVKQ